MGGTQTTALMRTPHDQADAMDANAMTCSRHAREHAHGRCVSTSVETWLIKTKENQAQELHGRFTDQGVFERDPYICISVS